MRPLVFLVALLLPATAHAQTDRSENRASPRPGLRPTGLFINLGLGALIPAGAFREETGRPKFESGVALGVELNDRFVVGIDLAAASLSSHDEQTALSSGLELDVTTTTTLTTLQPFARYNLPVGRVRLYAQAMGGGRAIATRTKLDSSNESEAPSQTQRERFAPAWGVAGGFMLDSRGLETVGVQVRYVRSAQTEYLLYDEQIGRFTERLSPTEHVAVTVRLNFLAILARL